MLLTMTTTNTATKEHAMDSIFSLAPEFSVNQIVRGKVCGVFVILAFRYAGDVRMAQIKEIDPATQKLYPGEMCLPVDCLRPYH